LQVAHDPPGRGVVALRASHRDPLPDVEQTPVRRQCSQAQQRFWFEEQLHPGNPGLNVAVRWRLEGELAPAHLAQAWRLVVARHETLRTSFVDVEGEPVAIVAAHAEFYPTIHDLRHLDEAAAALEAERLADIEATTPFDLSVAPLIRVSALQIQPAVWTLLVTAHHTVCDGWSVGILAREFGTICAALASSRPPDLPRLPITYGDYTAAQRAGLAVAPLEEASSYARRMLEGYRQFEVLPDRQRPVVQTSNGSIASVLLDRSLTNSLSALSARSGCTLFMTAYAALLVLLYRHTAETDIALGTQVVGRDDVEVENLVGCFINTLALRCDLSGDPTFAELLERARDAVLATFEARALPLERLIEIVNPKRDLSRNALFSTNFIFQRSFIENARYGDFSLVDLPSRSAGALYDLNFFMVAPKAGGPHASTTPTSSSTRPSLRCSSAS